jgi:hypothetical protein
MPFIVNLRRSHDMTSSGRATTSTCANKSSDRYFLAFWISARGAFAVAFTNACVNKMNLR